MFGEIFGLQQSLSNRDEYSVWLTEATKNNKVEATTVFRGILPNLDARVVSISVFPPFLLLAGGKKVYLIDKASGTAHDIQLLNYPQSKALFTDAKVGYSQGSMLVDAASNSLVLLRAANLTRGLATVATQPIEAGFGTVAGIAPIYANFQLAFVTGFLGRPCIVQAINITSGKFLPGVGRGCIDVYPWSKIASAPIIVS